MEDFYEAVNAAWPETLPVIGRTEAQRAARKLMLHFGHQRSGYFRRCWIVLNSRRSSDLSRGWRRLVHDVSHRVFYLENPRATDHGGMHAKLELEMVRYVLAKGWLTGGLRSAPRVARSLTPEQRRQERLHRVILAVKRWEAKRKRADTVLKRLRKRVRYYQRALRGAAAGGAA